MIPATGIARPDQRRTRQVSLYPGVRIVHSSACRGRFDLSGGIRPRRLHAAIPVAVRP